MGKAKPKTRNIQVQIKQKRQQKLKKLREKYLNTSKKTEKQNILDKMQRIAPHLDVGAYVKEGNK